MVFAAMLKNFIDWLIEKLELAIARWRQKQFDKWYGTSWLGKKDRRC
jgi:hypothetical protein